MAISRLKMISSGGIGFFNWDSGTRHDSHDSHDADMLLMIVLIMVLSCLGCTLLSRL